MKQFGIKSSLVAALLGCTALCGCGQHGIGEVTCSSSGSTDAATQMIKDSIEKDATAKSKQDDGTFVVSVSNIRASIALLKLSFEDIRTTKSDPNSTKKFCTGAAKITFPIKMISDADAVRASKNLNSVSQLADAANAQKNADTISFNIDYDVQPTDDKTKVYAESDSITPQVHFLSELLMSALLKPAVDSQQASMQQQAQQQQAAQKQLDQAAHDQAVIDNKLSTQTISAAWDALAATTKAQILDQQRAWIAAKDADCKTQAASASTDPVAQDTARLKCDTAANQSRTTWLQQYMTGASSR